MYVYKKWYTQTLKQFGERGKNKTKHQFLFKCMFCFFFAKKKKKQQRFLRLIEWKGNESFEFIFCLFPVFCVFYYYVRRPKVVDHFKVLDELKLSSHSASFVLVLFVVLPFATTNDFIRKIINIWFGSLFFAVLSLSSTFWVLRNTKALRQHSKLKAIIMRQPTDIGRTFSNVTDDDGGDQVQSKTQAQTQSQTQSQKKRYKNRDKHSKEQTITETNPDSNLTLEQIIASKQGFHLFMQHLNFEFSMHFFFKDIKKKVSEHVAYVFFFGGKKENLLSVTEMVQFQHAIVYNPKYSMLEKLKLLTEKYIVIGSELELNISSRLRQKIVAFVQVTNEQLKNDDALRQDALYLLDPVVDEIVSVMMDSYWRLLSLSLLFLYFYFYFFFLLSDCFPLLLSSSFFFYVTRVSSCRFRKTKAFQGLHELIGNKTA
ncbi:hypothetical protein RFI_00495 [Reticulomyxa filosa]|uniref:RGS domain-containing protein n=1 Tax=Reticulomyxa filosa TaxID=46433 RepID=X6PFU5_RETFI|nr:hypothetical protein RFI_00495 [Reticulomyxa filosa]|eukprot:ETO36567.1 hypothetical protein RFI_00495 [Reticulomyxa filosa]